MSRLTPRLDPAHQAAIGGLRVADQEQNEQHARERNQAGDDHEGIEQMRAGGKTRVRKPAGEKEDNHGADGGAGAA